MNPLKGYAQRVEIALEHLLPADEDRSKRLHQAMRYATLNGGKRIRAMLTYAAGHAMGVSLNSLDRPASAVEMIHAYSLVHDDLPAMDDDELRRGQPTCHIAFDEATAILVGDGLLSLAFETLANATDIDLENRVRMIAILASACGPQGMVKGQYMDIAGEQENLGLEQLRQIHQDKTGALIIAATLLGGLGTKQIDEASLNALQIFGHEIGIAFQIIDDILDETTDTKTLGKPSGSDIGRGKSTYPAAMGLEESKKMANDHYMRAQEALVALPGDTDHLLMIAKLVMERPF